MPDFGYNEVLTFKENQNVWKIFLDYVGKSPKYQRLSNYIKGVNSIKQHRQDKLTKAMEAHKYKREYSSGYGRGGQIPDSPNGRPGFLKSSSRLFNVNNDKFSPRKKGSN